MRRLAVVGLAVLLVLPVPWRLQLDDDPLALAWHLDGRLEVNGELLDPPGTWSWLTVGRPPLVAEVLLDTLDGGPPTSWDTRQRAADGRPAVVEPAAAALGLRAAGQDTVPDHVDAVLFGNLPNVAAIQWARDNLSLGPSHGLMVALTTWAAASDADLDGLHIAGTGAIRGDGSIAPIGGLAAKAAAARDADADVLFYPAPQADELADFDPGSMLLAPVDTLDDAITTLTPG